MDDKRPQLELINRDRNTIVSSILVEKIYEDGSIHSVGSRYVKVFKIQDINYKLSDDKHLIDEAYKNVLNSTDKNVEISLIVNSKKISKKYLNENVILKHKEDKFNYLRDGINETIRKNSSTETLIKEKYLIIAFKEERNEYIKTVNKNNKDLTERLEGATKRIVGVTTKKVGENLRKPYKKMSNDNYTPSNRMKIISSAIKRNFESISNARLLELTQDETIKLLYYLYNRDRVNDKLSNEYYDLISEKSREELNISYAELISPKTMEFHKDFIKFNSKFMIALHMEDINKQIDTDTVERLTDTNFEVLLGLKERPIDALTTSRLIGRELGNIEGEIYDIQKKLAESKVSVDLIPQMLKLRREEAIKINENIKTKNDGLFDMGLYALVFGDTYEECIDNVYSFINNATLSGIYFVISENMQENVFNTIMPFGINQTLYTRCINSEGLTAFQPFNAMDLIDENGDYYGKNLITNNPVVYDVMGADNYSMLLFGMTGKGKSMIGKQTILSRYLRDTKRQAIIIDASGEYVPIAKELNGQVINIEAGGIHHINLFDIDENYGDNPLADKEDMILSVCSLMQKEKLTAGQRTTVSMAVSEIYKKWLEDKQTVPTIEDFEIALERITKDDEENVEDKELLKAIKYYSRTSHCTLFRGKSNIDLKKNIINYNISNLGKELKPMAMEVLLDNIWLTISKNRAMGIDTDIIIDEFHLMFLNDDTAQFMAKLWKMLRKSHGCPIGITQNPEDVLNSFFGRDVIANTGFIVSLSLLESDIKLLKNILMLTEKEVEYIRNKEAGTGLIYVYSSKGRGSRVVVPFDNHYDENNIIYRLINTTDKINTVGAK